MKYLSNLSKLKVLILPVLLTACGGGSNENVSSEPVNHVPQAVAGASRTVLEEGSVILDARRSNDKDGGSLSYEWIQIGGPSVTLSNPRSVQPSFVAPNVDAVTELVFELRVNDAKQAVSTDKVIINVHQKTATQQAQQLMVRPVNTALVAQEGKALNVAFQYQGAEGSSLPTGLMLKLHWDSSRLSFKELSEALAISHLGVSSAIQDLKDDDHNPDTDHYVILSWLNYDLTGWPADINSPAPLFTASFEPVKDASGSTHITISEHFSSPGYRLQAQSVSVEL